MIEPNKGRKAQIAGQIFIYILAVIIVSFIILYGYSAIKSFGEKSDEVAYATLRTDMENSVTSILSDYGSIKRPNFQIPSKYRQVCVMNLLGTPEATEAAADGTPEVCQNDNHKDFNLIVCEGWKIGRDNVYLIPDGSEHFNIGKVELKDENYRCFDVVGGRIHIQFKSLGDKVEVSEYN